MRQGGQPAWGKVASTGGPLEGYAGWCVNEHRYSYTHVISANSHCPTVTDKFHILQHMYIHVYTNVLATQVPASS